MGRRRADTHVERRNNVEVAVLGMGKRVSHIESETETDRRRKRKRKRERKGG